MRNETRKWISQAAKDLGTAGFALNSMDGPLPVTTGLHCQKSAENYLKAYLQENQIRFSDHQNLNSLFEACILADTSFEVLRNDMNLLAGYSIASNYPESENSLSFREKAVATAKRVEVFVVGKLN